VKPPLEARKKGIVQSTQFDVQMIWKMLLFILVGYVALCLIVFIFQRKLLYLPFGDQLSEEHANYIGLHHWPSFDNFHGYVSSAEPDEILGTVIVFHGNAGTAYQRDFYVDALSPQNMRVILAEYPGYGGRDGHPSEDILVKDSLEIISLAYEMYGEPIYLWGESLGSGVVSSAVEKTDVPIKGIVLFLTWDSLPELAQTHYWFLPARWLVLDKYDNLKNLEDYGGKIAVILTEDDEVIPVKHGMRLYDSISTEKKLWVFEGFTHNEIPVGPDLPWWKDVIEFVMK